MSTYMINALYQAARDTLLEKGNAYVTRLHKELNQGEREPKAIAHSYISGLADSHDIGMDNNIRRQLHSAINEMYEHFGITS